MHRKVDPAALLFAILAVAISPLTTVGPWDQMNTIVASVVGAVLLAFTWPRKEILEGEHGEIAPIDKWMTAAQAIAYGLVVTIGTAWIVQKILGAPTDCPPYFDEADPPEACTRAVEIASDATYWALGIGAVAAIVSFFLMKRRIGKLAATANQ